MKFIVKHKGKTVAEYVVAPPTKRGDAHSSASDHARTIDGATVSRIDDDGTEKLRSTFSRNVLRDESLSDPTLSHQARNSIARLKARERGAA